MTDEDATLSRRTWREKHKPVVRYNRRIFDWKRSYVVPIAVVMFAASFGRGRNSGELSPEWTAWAIGGACVVLITALVIDIVRRTCTVRAAAVAAASGLLSAIVVVARNQGSFTTSVTVMLVTNSVCVLVGFLAIVFARRRRRLREPQTQAPS